MASSIFVADFLLAVDASMLPWQVAAQQLYPPCVEASRTSREFQTCTEYVDRRLQRQPVEKAYGRWIAFYEGPLRRYPLETYGPYRRRFRTTDKYFKANGDSLMSGQWTVHRKNGQLLVEDIYDHGYQRSSKTYDRRGRLREWFDFSIATVDEPYRCFIQKCTWVLGKETVEEYIMCKMDGVIAMYFAHPIRHVVGPEPIRSE